MLQNAYFLAKTGADTAENEWDFAEILPKFCQNNANYPTMMPLRHGRVEQRRLDAGALDLPVRTQFCPARQSPKTKKNAAAYVDTRSLLILLLTWNGLNFLTQNHNHATITVQSKQKHRSIIAGSSW